MTVEEILTFLLPVGIVSFVAIVFSSSLTQLLRGLWKLQLVLTIGVLIWFLVSIVPSYVIFLGYVMALLCIAAILAAIYKSTAKKKPMSVALKVALTGFLIFLLTAALDVFYALGIVPFGGYYLGYGIVVLILSFGYVLFDHYRTTIQNARNFAHELETARQIQSFILPHKTVDIKGIYLAAHYVPMASVAGDFYDFIKVDEKRLGILIADVSGHGVPASLISSMVKIAFSSQLPHAYNPAQVLSGINQILCGKLESDFVTAGYLFIDTEKQTATYAGAGHPPLLLWRGSEQKINEFRGKGIILGQFEDARYQNIELNLESGDRFLLYTDGIIEATNTSGDCFGWDHFKEFITSHANLSVGNFADGLIQGISNWSGKHIGEALDDDLTLVVAEFKNN